MALTDRQLAVVLEATVDRARELLEAQGGFPPFAVRGLHDGTIEFVDPAGDQANAPLERIFVAFGAMLAGEAQSGEIVAGALASNTALPDRIEPGFERAVAVQIEASGYCRSIVVPYRLPNGGGARVEFGTMISEASEPVIFKS